MTLVTRKVQYVTIILVALVDAISGQGMALPGLQGLLPPPGQGIMPIGGHGLVPGMMPAAGSHGMMHPPPGAGTPGQAGAPHPPTTTHRPFGILTADPQTAAYVVLMNGIVLAIIILFIWLPSVILLFFQIGIPTRSFSSRSAGDSGNSIRPMWEWDEASLLGRLAVLRDIWNKFDSSDPACRQRVVCELHRYQSHMGTIPRIILTSIDALVDLVLSVSPPREISGLLREYNDAKTLDTSYYDTCRKYIDCPYSIAQYIKYSKTYTY